ncbi:hypothetical protein ACUHGC_07515 [Testudinibacter sp. P27/CKL/0425]
MEIKPIEVGDWGGLRATLQTTKIESFRNRLKQITPAELKWWYERAGIEWQDSRTDIRKATSLSDAEVDKVMRVKDKVKKMAFRLDSGVIL